MLPTCRYLQTICGHQMTRNQWRNTILYLINHNLTKVHDRPLDLGHHLTSCCVLFPLVWLNSKESDRSVGSCCFQSKPDSVETDFSTSPCSSSGGETISDNSFLCCTTRPAITSISLPFLFFFFFSISCRVEIDNGLSIAHYWLFYSKFVFWSIWPSQGAASTLHTWRINRRLLCHILHSLLAVRVQRRRGQLLPLWKWNTAFIHAPFYPSDISMFF